MEELIVTSQEQLDAVPVDYNGKIIIKFGAPYNRAVVKRRYMLSVVARGNSSVLAWDNSSVVARDNSSVVARDNSSVVARGNSYVEARDNSSVVARGNSSVLAWGYSSVEARGNSYVEARDNSSVLAWGYSSVEARDNSSVVGRGNSSVVGTGNAQIVDATCSHKLKVSGNARIVYNPRTPQEYVDFYGLGSDGRTVTLYKAVHKKGEKYVSDNDCGFEYRIGEIVEADSLNTDQNDECGHGIHAAYKEWCVDYGARWPDLAILEVEMELDGLIVPLNGSGKVRAAKCKVLREVPLSECGLRGKMIEKARGKEDG